MRDKVLPYQWRVLNNRVPGAEKSHAIANFQVAAGLRQGKFYGYVFQDSDVAKWLETAGMSAYSRTFSSPCMAKRREVGVCVIQKLNKRP